MIASKNITSRWRAAVVVTPLVAACGLSCSAPNENTGETQAALSSASGWLHHGENGRVAGDGNAYGFAWDSASPVATSGQQVHFYVDGAWAGATVTSYEDQYWNNHFGVTGIHGFKWPIPDQYRHDGYYHTIKAYAITLNDPNSNAELPGGYWFHFARGDGSYCGDGACNNGETSGSCSNDCTPRAFCGDGVCNNGETCSSCEQDCPKKWGGWLYAMRCMD